MKRVLIFYSETGGGHLRGAQALADEIALHKGFEVVLSDGLTKFSWGQKAYPSFMFFIISHYLLPFFNISYKLTDNRFGIKVLRSFIKFTWGSSFKKIIDTEKPDLIITTHHFISPATYGNINRLSVIVVLDLGRPHRIWFDDLADNIIVPDQKMADWAKDKFKITDGKIKSIGYPLKKEFKDVKRLDFTNQILILGSGIRSSYVKTWIKKIKLAFPNKKIVVVCGHNRILGRRLSNIEGIEVLGFIDHLHSLLKDSDLVITKAGPATIMEAAALKKPLILVKWVGFQEKNNVDFVLENNLGLYDPEGINLASSISKIYKNYKKYTGNKNAGVYDTEKIVDYLLELMY